MADTKEQAESVVTPLEVLKSEQIPKEADVASSNRDYAGAQAKSNPAEIRLVRKLDLRIMVGIFLPILERIAL